MKSSRQLQRIFDGNDYNMQVGAVGCAMSYFKMYTELIYSDYDNFLFLEDDAEFAPNFENKLGLIIALVIALSPVQNMQKSMALVSNLSVIILFYLIYLIISKKNN